MWGVVSKGSTTAALDARWAHGADDLRATTDRFACRMAASRPEWGRGRQIGEGGVRLSGGQRQRVGIARALYHNPSVLVLDEATSSLDITTEGEFIDAVRALKGDKTLIIVTHRLTTVEHCDYLFRFENRKIIKD